MDVDSDPEEDQFNAPPRPEPERIALPVSDTPIINRNKEMRKKAASKGAGSGRRSSLGVRGRRASSLIDHGHTALPHHEVSSADFFKHISADGLPEARRMRILLTWLGERNMPERPPLGAADPHTVLGGESVGSVVARVVGMDRELTNDHSARHCQADSQGH
jgi:kinetochore protein Mis13/DSN1